jgi:hypothetical protein
MRNWMLESSYLDPGNQLMKRLDFFLVSVVDVQFELILDVVWDGQ